eukprot:scaffold49383_cov27-Tisochrysis_lutea.AAC.6
MKAAKPVSLPSLHNHSKRRKRARYSSTLRLTPSTAPVSTSTVRTISLSRARASKSVRLPLLTPTGGPAGPSHTGSRLDAPRMARAHRFTASWISSSVGVIVTCGIASSTSTSKKGRSVKRKPPEAREPARFLSAPRLALVQLSTAR